MTREEFLKNALNGFAKVKKELREDMEERDLRDTFVRAIVREVLGWEKGEGQGRYEVAEIRDITLFDDKDFPVAIIETKAPTESVKKKDFRNTLENRLRKHGSEHGVLVNGHRLILYSFNHKSGMEEISRINIDKISDKEVLELSNKTKDSILELRNLKRTRLLKITDEEYLSERHRVIDVSSEEGFNQLIEKIRVSLDEIMGAVRKYFKFYSKDDHPQAEFFRKAYPDWCSVSNRDKGSEESIETFCRETAYVILNRILFTRILDDKKLIAKAVSGKGLATSYESRKKNENPWLTIFDRACKDAKEYYEHFYMLGMFDWWKIEETKRELLDRDQKSELKDCETELNEAIGETLRLLNPFNFEVVDRDILGHIYQQYLPPEERKELGEFYTPTEVVKYILNSVGFKPENKIENKQLLDPACGSGTFLVESVNRLLKRYKNKDLDFDKAEDAKIALEGVIKHIHGLDINPFACHITEMNLLFQVIELYETIRRSEKYKDYTIPRFDIYNTDSLIPSEKGIELSLHDFEKLNSRAKRFIKEKREASKIKDKNFDFVVGNPPYVRTHKIKKDEYKDIYSSLTTGQYDISYLFVGKGVDWLKNQGKLGYITKNKLCVLESGIGIREYLLKSCQFEKFIDFSGVRTFSSSIPAAAIMTMKKVEKPKDVEISTDIKTQKDIPDDFHGNDLKSLEKTLSYLLENLDFYQVSQERFHENPELHFDFSLPDKNKPLIEKIEEKSERLIPDIVTDVKRGLRPDTTNFDDDFFVSAEKLDRKKLQEKDLYKPHLRGKDIVEKYRIDWNGEYIKFVPDKMAEGGDRKLYECPKIVIKELGKYLRCAYDDNEFYCNKTLHFLKSNDSDLDLKYLTGVLNSDLIDFYYKARFYLSRLGRGNFRFREAFLKYFPIFRPETEKEKDKGQNIENKVSKINQFFEKLEKIENKVSNFPKPYLEEDKDRLKLIALIDSQKLDDDNYNASRARYEKYQDLEEETKYKFILKRGHYVILDSKEKAEFLINLLENRDRITREEFLQIEMPKEEEISKIMEEFKADKDRIKEIEEEVKELESEINDLVYDLYGLDEEEIETVKKFLKRI